MSLGPIPWTAIVAYGERAGLDGREVDALVAIITAMDNAYLEWQAAKAKGGGGG